MVLRILGCRIGGRNWLSKIGFKIEIPLPEHLLDSGGWKEKRKKNSWKRGGNVLCKGFGCEIWGLRRKFRVDSKEKKRNVSGFLNEWKKKIGTRLLNRFGPFGELENWRRKKAWGKKIGGNEMEIENGGGKSRAAVWDCEWFSEKEIGCDLARQRLKLRLWISFRNDPTRWKNLKKVPRTGGKKEKEWGDCEEKKQLSLFSWTTKNQITKGMHLKRFWIWFLHGKEIWGYIE